MSVMRRLLNPYLRVTEKRRLKTATSPEVLRRAFERNARFFFWPKARGFAQCEIGGCPALMRDGTGPVLLYLHGGGYVFGSPRTHQAMVGQIADRIGCGAVLPDYRKAPEHAFPAALDDALAVYDALLERGHEVILGGDSAGGGLALALLAELLRQNRKRPLGVFALSPLTDLTFSAPSVAANAGADVVLPASRADDMAGMYLQGADPRDPRASPLFAVFSGAPPVWICVGDTEILLDDTRRIAERLRAQDIAVTEIIEHDLPHVWPIFHTVLPEARKTLDQLADWIRRL